MNQNLASITYCQKSVHLMTDVLKQIVQNNVNEISVKLSPCVTFVKQSASLQLHISDMSSIILSLAGKVPNSNLCINYTVLMCSITLSKSTPLAVTCPHGQLASYDIPEKEICPKCSDHTGHPYTAIP